MVHFPCFRLGDVVLTRSKFLSATDFLSRAGQAVVRLNWSPHSHAAICHSRHTILDAEPFERIRPHFVADWLEDVDIDSAVVLRPSFAVDEDALAASILRNFARPYDFGPFNAFRQTREPAFICSNYVADVYADFNSRLKRRLTLPVDLTRLLCAPEFTRHKLRDIEWTAAAPLRIMPEMLQTLLLALGTIKQTRAETLQVLASNLSDWAVRSSRTPGLTAILPLAEFVGAMHPDAEALPDHYHFLALKDFEPDVDDLRVWRGAAFVYSIAELCRVAGFLEEASELFRQTAVTGTWRVGNLDPLWDRYPVLAHLSCNPALPDVLNRVDEIMRSCAERAASGPVVEDDLLLLCTLVRHHARALRFLVSLATEQAKSGWPVTAEHVSGFQAFVQQLNADIQAAAARARALEPQRTAMRRETSGWIRRGRAA